jgi:hypothetical protein
MQGDMRGEGRANGILVNNKLKRINFRRKNYCKNAVEISAHGSIVSFEVFSRPRVLMRRPPLDCHDQHDLFNSMTLLIRFPVKFHTIRSGVFQYSFRAGGQRFRVQNPIDEITPGHDQSSLLSHTIFLPQPKWCLSSWTNPIFEPSCAKLSFPSPCSLRS